jgi:hypothetical protein
LGYWVLYPFKFLICGIAAGLVLWIALTKNVRRAMFIGALTAAFTIWSAPWVYVFAVEAWSFDGRCGMKRRYACTLGQFMWKLVEGVWPLLLFDVAVFSVIAFVFVRNWKRSRAPAGPDAPILAQAGS